LLVEVDSLELVDLLSAGLSEVVFSAAGFSAVDFSVLDLSEDFSSEELDHLFPEGER